MGGFGSGPYGYGGQYVAKERTSQCPELDIRILKRRGLLVDRQYFNWSWGIDEENIGIVVLPVNRDKLVLVYNIRGEEDTPLTIKTPIKLGYSRCNYGNERVWFHCPRCSKRVALLYLKSFSFRCRRCHDLTYTSCQESGNLNDMSMTRVNKALAKLKSKERCTFDILYYTPPRPRYMHSKTYKRLVVNYTIKKMEYAESIRRVLGSLDAL